MFDLAYPLDDTVEIDGKEYKLNLAFDNVLRLIDMLNDDELTDIAQIEIGLKMLIGTSLDDYTFEKKAEIFTKLFEETIGKEMKEKQPVDIEGNPMPHVQEEKVYDLKQDAEYIYASFMQDYGIDLFEQQGKLHWDKFKALLVGLRNDTKFKQVIEIRQMELPSGKGTAKERERIKKLKEIYALEAD